MNWKYHFQSSPHLPSQTENSCAMPLSILRKQGKHWTQFASLLAQLYVIFNSITSAWSVNLNEIIFRAIREIELAQRIVLSPPLVNSVTSFSLFPNFTQKHLIFDELDWPYVCTYFNDFDFLNDFECNSFFFARVYAWFSFFEKEMYPVCIRRFFYKKVSCDPSTRLS